LNSLASHPAVRGAQVFYAKPTGGATGANGGNMGGATGNTGANGGAVSGAQKYASNIQDALNGGNLFFNRRASVGDYFILNCTAYPSVLVECGFLSNPTDEKLLNTEQYQKMIANYIAVGILI
jgi:N-acetylmuramoyl-L-alanine amidase